MADRRTLRVTSVQVCGGGRVGPSLLCAAACTCLVLLLLLVQAAQIHRLREELRDLVARVDVSCCCGGVGVRAPRGRPEARDQDGGRPRREARKPAGARRRQRQVAGGRRTFLHLLPLSSHSKDEEDETLLKWTLGQSQGEGLQLSGEAVTVTTGGLYFIYSQVLYADTTYVMGHVIRKRVNDSETSLMKCMKSMPDMGPVALNTCYTAGAHYLDPGSVVELSIPRKEAGIHLQPHATFMGLYRL
ncbi:hypothetical protein AAFF_G00350690 [Aldrovandia affinis]|uniref:THD domain-containing protein n=1 Tax=Aldrovandia affinis TaxID=143900 RepID=A0AAD7R607_9TELE|nr:hypothetical protein AAFF_G00350690 [Aldrovandia affinis]